MSLLGSVDRYLSNAGGFVEGAGEGAYEGVKGAVIGAADLLEDGYKLAADSHYREQAWNSAVNDAKAAANFTAAAVADPGRAADQIADTASQAWHTLKVAYTQAAARGQGSEFVGRIFGQGAIMAGAIAIPGGAGADAAEAIGDAGRVTELLGEAGKLTVDTASIGERAAKPIARGEPHAYGNGHRSERAAAIIEHAAKVLGHKDASSLVDTVLYDPAADTPSFWVDPNTGERIITLNPATFRKTKTGQLITGTHELVHAEAWGRALSENGGDLATTHRQIFVEEINLIYAMREVQTERIALQKVKEFLGSLTPQQVGHSSRYINQWQARVKSYEQWEDFMKSLHER
jgi:hypothetical protein